ncbi:hypothetical protein VTJ49DRAFT_1489 [Mycothermus thermophilus]|uniref:GPI mannosyltransferase 2 n=1 Tax=Humicola insolens TaxID=85995 RepID=A0ABR3VCI5_HUMIN
MVKPNPQPPAPPKPKTHTNNAFFTNALTHPYRTLTIAFVAWKLILFLIAFGAVLAGEAYDSSADLVVHGTGSGTAPRNSLITRLVTRFSSWDAIYFVSIAHGGYLHEQYWAFGSGLPGVVRGVVTVARSLGLASPAGSDGGGAFVEAVTGIIVANTAHLLSTFTLYRLGEVVFESQQREQKQQTTLLPLLAALLHILSPAGLFLSAPYAESSFALLSFTGCLLFALACRLDGYGNHPVLRDAYTVLAGVVFGAATVFRSNGILNGIPFAWEAVRQLAGLVCEHPRRSKVDVLRRLVALGLGGVCVAAGTVIPQAVAYQRFCLGAGEGSVDPRPWCGGWVPSIYAFVQSYYWNTGFLRYWTISNLPLFLLAAPMLTVLGVSGMAQLRGELVPLSSTTAAPKSAPSEEKSAKISSQRSPTSSSSIQSLLTAAAAAQVLLAVLAFTSYHVQIITRLSSGYPLWYWWLAGKLVQKSTHKDAILANRVVTFAVAYAAVQGGLFASFLPPA